MQLEQNLTTMPSITAMLNEGMSPEAVTERILQGLGVMPGAERVVPKYGPCEVRCGRLEAGRGAGGAGRGAGGGGCDRVPLDANENNTGTPVVHHYARIGIACMLVTTTANKPPRLPAHCRRRR